MLPSRPKAVLISLVASYLLSALLLFILTFVLYRLKLKESQIAPAVYALYGIPSAAPRAGTRAFPDTSGTGLLRGRRHGRRNFKLMKKERMQQS